MTDLHPHPTTHPLSPSHTSSGQWTTGSTLVVESPPSITSQATGHHEAADPAEPVTLKLRVSQLEVALEEIRCRLDALSTEKQGMLIASAVDDPRKYFLMQTQTRLLASQQPLSPNHPPPTFLLPLSTSTLPSYLPLNFHPQLHPLSTRTRTHSPH